MAASVGVAGGEGAVAGGADEPPHPLHPTSAAMANERDARRREFISLVSHAPEGTASEDR
jgi:hypothetical protein